MQVMQAFFTWLFANWLPVLAVTVYIVINLAPRPHPDEQTGLKRVLWAILDRVSLLTAKQVPGKVKWLFAASESERPPAPTQPDEKP